MRIPLIAALAAATLAGCGGDKTAQPTAAPAQPATSSAPSQPALSPAEAKAAQDSARQDAQKTISATNAQAEAERLAREIAADQ